MFMRAVTKRRGAGFFAAAESYFFLFGNFHFHRMKRGALLMRAIAKGLLAA